MGYIIALGLVALLSVGAYCTLKTVIGNEKNTSSLMNISGRQRQLSQTIAFCSLMLASKQNVEKYQALKNQKIEEDSKSKESFEDKEGYRRKLQESVALMQRSHTALTTNSGDLGLPRVMTPAIHRIYFEAPVNLDQQVRSFLKAAENLASKDSTQIDLSDPDLKYVVDAAPSRLVSSLDGAVKQYESDAKEQVEEIEQIEMGVVLFTLLLLIIEARWIFFPMSKKIEEQLAVASAISKNLNDSQDRYDLAVEGSQDGIWDWNLADGTVFYSPQCYKQLGYGQGDLNVGNGDELMTLIHPEDAESVGRAVEAHLTQKAPYDIEYRARTKDGGYRWIHSKGQAMWNAEGKPIRFAGSHRDVTDRVLSQQKLLDAESRFRQMAENINEIFWITDDRGFLPTYVSPAYEAVYGRSVASLFENPSQFIDSVHPDDKEKLVRLIKLQRKSPAPTEIEYRVIRADGSVRWLWARLSPFLDGEQKKVLGFCGVTADITTRKESEKRISEFHSTISHELRTPMTSIRGALGLMEGGKAGELSGAALKLVQIGRLESDRLIRLINNLLDLKKIETGSLELEKTRLKPAKLLSQTVEAMRGLLDEADIELTVDASTNDAVMGDADRLVQVLTNLIANAIKFSERGGRIEVTAVSATDDKVRFGVRDFGPGIKGDDLPKLFMKFQQVDQSDSRAKGGTGLGLAISKAIIEEHGGTIGVDTEEGKGACFWFEIFRARSDIRSV